jgi:hypothetical protein
LSGYHRRIILDYNSLFYVSYRFSVLRENDNIIDNDSNSAIRNFVRSTSLGIGNLQYSGEKETWSYQVPQYCTDPGRAVQEIWR